MKTNLFFALLMEEFELWLGGVLDDLEDDGLQEQHLDMLADLVPDLCIAYNLPRPTISFIEYPQTPVLYWHSLGVSVYVLDNHFLVGRRRGETYVPRDDCAKLAATVCFTGPAAVA